MCAVNATSDQERYLKLYGLKNCDSCKRLSQLRAAGHDIVFDIRADPLDQAQIADLLARHGDQLVLNRQSTTWRNLAESDRLLPPEALLAAPDSDQTTGHFDHDTSYVGWGQDVQTACGMPSKLLSHLALKAFLMRKYH